MHDAWIGSPDLKSHPFPRNRNGYLSEEKNYKVLKIKFLVNDLGRQSYRFCFGLVVSVIYIGKFIDRRALQIHQALYLVRGKTLILTKYSK